MFLLRQYKQVDARIDIFVGAAGLLIQLRDDTNIIHWQVRGYPKSYVEAIREVCRSGMDATGTVDDIPQVSAEFTLVPDESEWVRAFWNDSRHGGSGWRMTLRKNELLWIANFLEHYWVI